MIKDKWFVVNAEGHRIGRVASIVAELLQGKNDPRVLSNLDPKAHVVVLNADKVDFTEKRGFSKFYKFFSGYPSGLRFESLEDQIKKDPKYPLEHAVKGMLPKTKTGAKMFSRLKVIAGDKHEHEAQKPVQIDISNFKL